MLDDAYARCRQLHREHGRSYYLATRLLPAAKRRHVHALYAFTRWADEIVDGPVVDGAGPRLDEWGRAFAAAMSDAVGDQDVADPILLAVRDTVRRFGLDLADFDVFLRSMAADLKITRYATYGDLLGYMEGSAAAIGTMMTPILGLRPGADPAVARTAARELGYAFQLTNFIRDVREDLERGRIYLPEEDLDRFGVTVDLLGVGGPTPRSVRDLIAFESGRARGHYAAARVGIDLLEPRSRLCVRAAYLLYREILDEVARRDHDVLRGRAVVSRPRRAALVAYALSGRPLR